MDPDVITLIKFSLPLEFPRQGIIASRPCNLKYVCITDCDRHVTSIYSLQSVQDVTHASVIWECSENVGSVTFSEDGDYILVVLGTYSPQVFHVYDEVTTILEASVDQLEQLLQENDIVTGISSLEPVAFTSSYAILLVSERWLVRLDWCEAGELRFVAAVEVPQCTSFTFVKDTAYALTTGGNVVAVAADHMRQLGSVNLFSLWPQDAGDAPGSFQHLAVSADGATLATADAEGKVFLVSVVGMFTSPDSPATSAADWECSLSVASSSSLASVTSSRSAASKVTSAGSDGVQLHLSKKQKAKASYLSTWNSYLSSLQNWKQRDRKRGPSSQLRVVGSAPSGLGLASLRLTAAGLAAWYAGPEGGVYRLYEAGTGRMLAECAVPAGNVLVRGSGEVDTFLSPERLWLPLCGVSRETLLAKLLHCVEEGSVGQLLQGEEWGGLAVPIATLEEGLRHHHMQVARFALGLHAQAFKRALKLEGSGPEEQEEVEAVLVHLDQLLGTISRYVRGEERKLAFSEQLALLTLDHANMLLWLARDAGANRLGTEATRRVMGYVAELRGHLYGQARGGCGREGSGELCWGAWSDMAEADIIRDAVTSDNAPRLLAFLVSCRGYTASTAREVVRQEVDAWVRAMLAEGRIHNARKTLANYCCDPDKELWEICVASRDTGTRDYVATHLSSQGLLSEAELTAWRFLQQLEAVFQRHHLASEDSLQSDSSPGSGAMPVDHRVCSLAIQTVVLQSEDWRKDVLTVVYFNTLDEALLDVVDGDRAWACLLRHNNTRLLLAWAGHWLQDTEQLPGSLDAGLSAAFARWPLTQDMIDSVGSSRCTRATKDILLDYLARVGVFTDTEKHNVCSILWRLARCGKLQDIRAVLGSPRSSLTYEEFETLLARFCARHGLYHVAFSCLSDSKVAVEGEGGASWWQLWRAFRQGVGPALLEATGRYLGGTQSPLVDVAAALYSQVPLEEVPAARSVPLLDVALASRHPSAMVDVNLYQLLRSFCPFNVLRLFSWQDTHTPSTRTDEPPHFSDPKLVTKYGYKDTLSFLHYLKQGRPSFAANVFIAEQWKTHRKFSKKVAAVGSNLAHGLALQHFQDPCVTAACVSFTEMLGRSSQLARVHLAMANAILRHLDGEGCGNAQSHHQQLGVLMHGLTQNSAAVCSEFLGLLEVALQKTAVDLTGVALLLHWQPAVQFATLHHLQLPSVFLEHCARHDQWLLFVLFVHVYNYPMAQVLELTKLFSSAKLREHLYLALSLGERRKPRPGKQPRKSWLQQHNSNRAYYSRIGISKAEDIDKPVEQGSGFTGSLSQLSSSSGEDCMGSWAGGHGARPGESPFEGDDLFLTLLQCHGGVDPHQSLLATAYDTCNPVYAIFACCYQPSALVACLCTWVSVSVGWRCRPTSWSAGTVTQLAEDAVRAGHVRTLARGWSLFLPDSPLCSFLTFLHECVVLRTFEDSIISLKLFKAACINLRNTTMNGARERDDAVRTFIHDSSWIAGTAVRLANAALDCCFSSMTHQRHFLRTLCRAAFTEHLPAEAPDYEHLWQVGECLAGSGVRVSWARLLACPGPELQRCLDQLVAAKCFPHALRLADIASLPCGRILTAQWLFKLEQLLEGGKQFFVPDDTFFSECEAEFQQFGVDPDAVTDFFKLCASKVTSYKERYCLLRYALAWLRRGARRETHTLEEDRLELDMWTCWLATDETTVGSMEEYTVLRSCLSQLTDACPTVKAQLASKRDVLRLELLVGLLLEQGRVETACRLEAMFQHSSKELTMLLSSLRLAEGSSSPYQLPQVLRMMLSETSIGYRHRMLRLSSVSSVKSEGLVQQGSEVDGDLGLTQEQQDTFSVLEGLTSHMTHAAALGRRVALCYWVAAVLCMPFKSVLELEDPLNLLWTDHFGERPDMLLVASGLIRAEAASAEEVADLLCHKIVEAVGRATSQGESVPCVVWGCDLNSSFHLLLDLCADPSLLGYKLLSAAADISPCTSDTLHQVVELVVRAHDCFSAACNMEGIVGILRRAQIISRSLLHREEWSLMVRLLTGVGRFTEMSYIFQMLKKNNRFEFLLGKGMDKVPGLKTAALDFLEKHHSDDKDTIRIVALHFQLHGRVGAQCLREGEVRLGLLPSPLRNCPPVCQALTAAMLDFSQAAQYLLQAEKLTAAMSAAHQAELVALQLSVLSTVPADQTATCVLQLSPEQVSHLITHTLSFPQACIVARAYGHPVDWGAALFQHCVVRGRADYLPDFTRSMQLTPALVEDVAYRFQKEAAISKDMVAQMKKFVLCVSNVEVRYRVASQLGFRDVVESLLNSSSLAYLKDTVWRSGFRQ